MLSKERHQTATGPGWKVVIRGNPRGCTGAPMNGFAGNTTLFQIVPWLGSWITLTASQAVFKISGFKGVRRWQEIGGLCSPTSQPENPLIFLCLIGFNTHEVRALVRPICIGPAIIAIRNIHSVRVKFRGKFISTMALFML
jgi:hypothetical protein